MRGEIVSGTSQDMVKLATASVSSVTGLGIPLMDVELLPFCHQNVWLVFVNHQLQLRAVENSITIPPSILRIIP